MKTFKPFSFEEKSLILAYYLFEHHHTPSSLMRFTNQLNNYSSRDLSPETVSYQIAVFRNLDPFLSSASTQSSSSKVIWDFYNDEQKRTQLKKFYQSFKLNDWSSGNLIHHLDDEIALEDKRIQIRLNSTSTVVHNCSVLDKPKTLYNKEKDVKTSSYRDPQVSQNALIAADFLCEFDESHSSFIRKSDSHKYMEAHHLVPLKYQYLFDVNLDVEANVVSLCSNCHNELHYGKYFELILERLYTKRLSRLNNCGIYISYDILKDMYR